MRNKGKGSRKMYSSGASASPADSLGAKDKNTGSVGMPKAEGVDYFQCLDKAHQPSVPVRRSSDGDVVKKFKK